MHEHVFFSDGTNIGFNPGRESWLGGVVGVGGFFYYGKNDPEIRSFAIDKRSRRRCIEESVSELQGQGGLLGYRAQLPNLGHARLRRVPSTKFATSSRRDWEYQLANACSAEQSPFQRIGSMSVTGIKWSYASLFSLLLEWTQYWSVQGRTIAHEYGSPSVQESVPLSRNHIVQRA